MLMGVTFHTRHRLDRRTDDNTEATVTERRKLNLSQASRLLRQIYGEDAEGTTSVNLGSLARPGGRMERAGMTIIRPQDSTWVMVYEDELLEFWQTYIAGPRRGRPKSNKT